MDGTATNNFESFQIFNEETTTQIKRFIFSQPVANSHIGQASSGLWQKFVHAANKGLIFPAWHLLYFLMGA